MRASTFIGAFLLVAATSQAEVRLIQRPGSPGVRMTSTGRGPWSPTGRIDASLLNPTGDLAGDSAPSVAMTREGVLAAWRGGEDGGIRLAIGTATWRLLPTVGAARANALPMAASVDASTFVVAWTDLESDETQLIAMVGSGTARSARPIAGHLLALSAAHGSVWVLTANGSRVDLTVLQIHLPDPQPDPFLRVGAWTLPGLLLGAGVGPLATVLEANPEFTSSREVAILSWWSSDRELSYVELTPDGPVFPVETITAHGNGTSRPASLRREALKVVEDR